RAVPRVLLETGVHLVGGGCGGQRQETAGASGRRTEQVRHVVGGLGLAFAHGGGDQHQSRAGAQRRQVFGQRGLQAVGFVDVGKRLGERGRGNRDRPQAGGVQQGGDSSLRLFEVGAQRGH